MRCQPALGVAIGRRRVAVDRAEVALAVDQRVAHREILRHAHQGVVGRGVAVRVVLTEHVADDARAFHVRAVPDVVRLVHGEQHAAVHRLQAVAHIRQRAPDDHAHRVIEIGAAHLFFEADREGFFGELIHWLQRRAGHIAQRSSARARAARLLGASRTPKWTRAAGKTAILACGVAVTTRADRTRRAGCHRSRGPPFRVRFWALCYDQTRLKSRGCSRPTARDGRGEKQRFGLEASQPRAAHRDRGSPRSDHAIPTQEDDSSRYRLVCADSRSRMHRRADQGAAQSRAVVHRR